MRHTLFSLLGVLAMSGCASKLDRELTDKAPKGSSLETELELDEVVFRGVADGAQVKLGEAMRANGWRHLLLVFGSRGCAICNKEARTLQDEVIGRHALFFTSAGQNFQVVGVNTDGVLDARLRAYLAPLPFIQWNDPAGSEMLAHFMPAGRRFAVPLTVLVRAGERGEAGIVWRVLPEQATAVSVDELMLRVERELNGEAGGGAASDDGALDGGGAGDGAGDGGAGDGAGDGGAGDGGAGDGGAGDGAGDGGAGDGAGDGGAGDGAGDGGAGDGGAGDGSDGGAMQPRARTLQDAAPGRLGRVEASDCGGARADLDALAADVDYMFVQTARSACDDSCRALGALVESRCEAGLAGGKTCRFVRLSGSAPEACKDGVDFTGSAPFYEVFATHFNWAYRPIENPDYTLSLPEVAGSLLFGFARDGSLVLSHEGALERRAFDAMLEAALMGKAARGPDFRFYGKPSGEQAFADLRHKARFTVVNSFSTICSSCITELKHWSSPGNLVDFCAAQPGDCQVVAVERTDGVEPGGGLSGYYDSVIRVLESEAIRVPVLLDPAPLEDYLARFFDGYVSALKPEWGGLYGTLVYDREGKVVTSFAPFDESGGRHDEAVEYLRNVLRGDAQ